MGVCSALFELGGMTIMHDASGCNSTYTTHDEPRWYDMDSMVYISALTEMEAIMGDDEKILGDIEDAVRELHPRFVAIAGTPIPTMTGFDFKAVAAVAEQRTGIPCFGFATTGMNTYVHGAAMAFEAIARNLVSEPETAEKNDGAGNKIRVNTIGLTPLDFSVNGQDKSIAKWLESKGFEVVSKWAMGSSPDEIAGSAGADVNLVVSASGISAAKVLFERYKIPYVIGVPVGHNQKELIISGLEKLAGEKRAHEEEKDCILSESLMIHSDITNEYPDRNTEKPVVIIGEYVTSLALANAIEFELDMPTRVLCATECPREILREKDSMTPYEDDIIPNLAGAGAIIADPLYKPICPPDISFISLPSEAFSGRLYRAEIPNLIEDPQAVLSQL